MTPRRLLLVRWFGDVVATADLPPDQSPDMSWLDPDARGVTFEVMDVTDDRFRRSVRSAFDVLPFLTFWAPFWGASLVSIALLTAAIGAAFHGVDEDRVGLMRSYLTRISAEDAPEGAPVHVAAQPDPPVSEPLSAFPPKPPMPDPPILPASPPGPSPLPARALRGGKDAAWSAPAVCAVAKASSTGPTCSRGVEIATLERSSPSCFVDAVVRVGERGGLEYPCDGDGVATLRIGSTTFEGAMNGGKVEVCTGTEFPWSDGCAWTSAQRVTGSLEDGLRFTYGEAPKKEGARCAPACSARGTVRLLSSSASHSGAQRPSEAEGY